MSKPLTLSVCLAIALASTSGIAKAGGHGGLLPSPQAVAAPQYVAPSAQGILPSGQGYAGEYCAPEAKHCGFKLPKLHMPKICLPKIELPKCPPKCYEYEWVLKKKRCGGGLLGMLGNGCGHGADECGVTYGGDIYPSGQYASPQVAAAPQAYPTAQYTGDVYGAGQAYGAGQMYSAEPAPGEMAPAPVETDEAPEAPVVPSAYGRLGSSLFGTNR
jgi:hypothetical protein